MSGITTRWGAMALVLLLAAATGARAATALKFGAPVDVSATPAATAKAKVVRLAYADGGVFRKAWLAVYGDGPAGREDVYARVSFDEGVTWLAPRLLSRDAAGGATGGQAITVRGGLAFVVDNDKPGVFAPPLTSGPKVVVAWNSAYCPADPGAATSGPYVNAQQGAGDFDGDGTPDRPFHCEWVATSTDPALQSWDVQQLTTGVRDAIGEVISGNATGDAWALAWQEDPAGLRPGEAEGRGDGGSGANVSGGTNIWYTHAGAPDGAALRANVSQLSDNDRIGNGLPGASRPNLQVSGSTAVVAYEETACAGGNGGKCIVYHAFPYAKNDVDSPGAVISDPATNSRRVRFVLQGAAAAGDSRLRTVVLWRESPTAAPAAPADIVVRRGFVDTAARPGSNGFLASDVLADAPQHLTRVAATGGNANAHRAVLRGDVVLVAYDLTPDMAGADATRTPQPTANYDLFLTRSTAAGDAGTWSAPANLSRLPTKASTVVEPRLVPTPGTVVNPLTGQPDATDTQDTNVVYIAYATESNDLAGRAGQVLVSRSTDLGASFEPFVPVSAAAEGQSESQLRPTPDGSAVAVLWMGEQVPGDAATQDAMFASADAVPLPDLRLGAADASLAAGTVRTITLTVSNRGAGEAHGVTLRGTLPAGLAPWPGIDPRDACRFDGPAFECLVGALAAGQSEPVTLALLSPQTGVYILSATVTSADLDADAADNQATAVVDVTAPAPPSAGDAGTGGEGGGCTMARGESPFDPVLPLLAGLALAGIARRRGTRGRRPSLSRP